MGDAGHQMMEVALCAAIEKTGKDVLIFERFCLAGHLREVPMVEGDSAL